jgi:hypothetical protein
MIFLSIQSCFSNENYSFNFTEEVNEYEKLKKSISLSIDLLVQKNHLAFIELLDEEVGTGYEYPESKINIKKDFDKKGDIYITLFDSDAYFKRFNEKLTKSDDNYRKLCVSDKIIYSKGKSNKIEVSTIDKNPNNVIVRIFWNKGKRIGWILQFSRENSDGLWKITDLGIWQGL